MRHGVWYGWGVMNKLLLTGMGLMALALASCAPVQGQKPMIYQGKTSEVLAALTQIAPTVQASRNHNFYSVIQATPNQVTLEATATPGFVAFGASVPIRVTFTALESGTTTVLTHAVRTEVQPNLYSPAIANIYAELGKRFPLVP